MAPMRAFGWTSAALLAAVAMASCAVPARRLTTRVVDDRIVLPKRMASVSLDGRLIHYEPTDAQAGTLIPGFRFGITERLEWVDLLSLRYAILDDRPADGRPPMPLSLAVRAGMDGVGYSSMEGWLLLPVASVDVLKHVGDRWALSMGAAWQAFYVESPAAFITPAYSGGLGYSSRRWSDIGVRGDVIRQLNDHFALGFSAGVDQLNDCVSPACAWKSRGAGASLRLIARPWHWLTVSAGPAAGIRHRPNLLLPLVYPNGDRIPIQPLTVEWVSLSGFVAFFW
jgi:hypothetical protein